MAQDVWYCYNHPVEFPYEVSYNTAKQRREKTRYFQTLEQVKTWCKTHKSARINSGSWQVFEIMKELTE